MKRVVANHKPLCGISEHHFDRFGTKSGAVDFAITDNARIGYQLHKNKITPTKAWGWVANDESFELFNHH
ncbi:hypothetical protein N9164_16760 [Draconibacterium sp.]|nr:hypothetical protein [Draconibacterium sp.]